MANLTGRERAHYVRGMFARIASRYDRMNRLMTAGQDVRWRREVIQLAEIPANGRLLDLGAGTGDLAREGLRQRADCTAVAADFTPEMMQVGRQQLETVPQERRRLSWCAADAQSLPFPGKVFQVVVSGFLMRNVGDLPLSLKEQHRVLLPGGRIVILDTSPPPPSILAPFIRFHLHTVIPWLGRLITGQADAYHYLPDSTEAFLEPEQMLARLQQAGFEATGYARRMFGTVAIYWGVKPRGNQ